MVKKSIKRGKEEKNEYFLSDLYIQNFLLLIAIMYLWF